MKYIISESRLERIVVNYLSSLDFNEGYRDSEGFDIMHNGDQAMSYRRRYERLYISIAVSYTHLTLPTKRIV